VGSAVAAFFGTMAIGFMAARSGMLTSAARKGISAIYVKVVYPTMVFRGIATVHLEEIDVSILFIVLIAKFCVVATCVSFGKLTLLPSKGNQSLAHAAVYAMSSSHSFDIAWGTPIATLVFPLFVPYIYLNQTVQLVLVNPVLLILIEVGVSSGGNNRSILARASRVMIDGVLLNPLVIGTVAGLVVGRIYPDEQPMLLRSLVKQGADAGLFLGFLSLGCAMSTLGGITTSEIRHSLVLCSTKMVLLPFLYVAIGKLMNTTLPDEFLMFLGSLPASASVYSLSFVRNFSPKVIGPLVPLSLVFSLIFTFSPLTVELPVVHAVIDGLRFCLGIVGLGIAIASFHFDRQCFGRTTGSRTGMRRSAPTEGRLPVPRVVQLSLELNNERQCNA